MARACTTCEHPERDTIDLELVGGRAVAHVAERFGLVAQSIHRHKATHLPASLAVVPLPSPEPSADDVARAASLLDRVERLADEAEGFLRAAKKNGSVTQGLAAIRELRAILELRGKASGELRPDGPVVNVLNVTADPEWQRIRSTLMAALAPFPEAAQAVAHALRAPSSRPTSLDGGRVAHGGSYTDSSLDRGERVHAVAIGEGATQAAGTVVDVVDRVAQ